MRSNMLRKRSFFLKVLIFILTISIYSCKEENNNPKDKGDITPNFLVIIADDAGWGDFSYHGSKIQTPVIDSLAETGVQLERFYVAPTCSPSRASLLTGRPASRMGIVAPISGKSELSLPDSLTTLPQALKERDYRTALFGKWHLGLRTESGPKAYGFDYSYGFLHGQIDQYTHRYKNGDSSWYRNDKFITEEGHATDLITDEAIEWLEKQSYSTGNFFMQVAYSAPHFPLQEEDKWKEPYKEVFEEPSRRDYAAALAHMDHSVGKLLASLKEKGLDKNTVVLFISDNGAMESWYPTDQYNGKFGPNPVLGNNEPLRDWKTSNYEGAIRVPALINWKGHLSADVNKTYLSAADVMPTFLALAGVENIPESIEGKNAWPAITGAEKSWENPIYIRGHLQESIINKPWKFIRTRHLDAPSEFELYNIEEDPEEQENVVEGHPNIASRLEDDLKNQFAKDAKEVNLELQD
ncbi:sulfatase-like hydrolase/transferase [Salegentibacter sp. F188]|uniref:Sulfatase-like hydrolase/transferase n=1 Tax=Autumnicola patrickiae TaxID=3075591 RepID=A0ABU3DZQ4_9FLAO|nr:sulfatase-like hydrolase/transferase [Salegentibacter sp. F188]MDT0688919.1 sulfatase-like hydrolase/transferase [Salegentibacter sp. F188]